MSNREANQAKLVMANANFLPDEHSHGVYKMLMDVYPAFAKKLFQNNYFMQKLVMSGMTPMQILDYPVCGKCETLALYNDYGFKDGRWVSQCTCVAKGCGQTTINPVTLRDWIKDELKHKAPPDFMEVIEYAIDAIASSMIRKYYKDNAGILESHSAEAGKKLGVIYDKDGNQMKKTEEKAKIVHIKTTPDEDIDVKL
jgi:hypothetical protein